MNLPRKESNLLFFCYLSNVLVVVVVFFITASFEVTVDGKLVFSKLEKGAFPVFKEVNEDKINSSLLIDLAYGSNWGHALTKSFDISKFWFLRRGQKRLGAQCTLRKTFRSRKERTSIRRTRDPLRAGSALFNAPPLLPPPPPNPTWWWWWC